jgi:hypothetical protein
LKKHVSAFELYTNMLSNYILSGIHDPKIPLREDELQIESCNFYSHSSMWTYFYVKDFPQALSFSLIDIIRKNVETENVVVDFQLSGWGHQVNFESATMKEHRRVWNEQLVNGNNRTSDILKKNSECEIRNREDWLIVSWKYYSNLKENRHSCIACNYIIRISTRNRKLEVVREFYKAIEDLQDYCKFHRIKIKQVRNFTYNFLQFISMFGDKTPYIVKKHKENISTRIVPVRLLGDDIISKIGSFYPGPVRSKGVPIGINFISGEVVYKNFARATAEAETILFAGGAGSGKTVMVKCLSIMLMANKYIFIVLDRQGEYVDFCNRAHGITVSLSSTSGKYVDTVVIGDLTGIESIDASLYDDAISETLDVFSALCESTNKFTGNQLKIFNDAYNRILTRAGVEKDKRDTWKLSAKLSYHSLFYEIKELSQMNSYKEAYGSDIEQLVATLSVFFEPDGIMSYLFQHKISINEVIYGDHIKFIDIVMNLKDGKVASTLSGVPDTIKCLTATHLVIKLTNYYRSLGLFSVHDFEEYNEYPDESPAQYIVNTMITGNRKRNAITLIVTNAPDRILYGKSEVGANIRDNITSAFLGKLSPTMIDASCKLLSLVNCEGVLSGIANDKKFHNCFLAKLDNDNVVLLKAVVHPDLVDSPLFESRSKKMNQKSLQEEFNYGNKKQTSHQSEK